jgi:hypothetical protein
MFMDKELKNLLIFTCAVRDRKWKNGMLTEFAEDVLNGKKAHELVGFDSTKKKKKWLKEILIELKEFKDV